MTLVVRVPRRYLAERTYVVATLIQEFLGIPARIEAWDREGTEVCEPDSSGSGLTFADGLFLTQERDWLTPASLPTEPAVWSSPFEEHGGSLDFVYGAQHEGTLPGVDIFGSAFFLLTRYEEIVQRDHADCHGRFPASSSFAHRHGLLERPLVNEYADLLWRLLARRWPRLERRWRSYTPFVSHDIDEVGQGNKSVAATFKASVGDVIARRDVALGAARLKAAFSAKAVGTNNDLRNTIAYLAGESERLGLRSAFYFIPKRDSTEFSANYDLHAEHIRGFLRELSIRGHEVGFHGSYMTYGDTEALGDEFATLRRIASESGVRQSEWGGRQHYLRWRAPMSWRAWAEVGLDYDSSAYFAEAPGFRCGTCYDFRPFDLLGRTPLNVTERPLSVMDVTLLGRNYLALNHAGALEAIKRISAHCKRHRGTFGLLWHNTQVLSKRDRWFYREVLQAAM